MRLANSDIRLAKQVRHATLLKPFFPNHYERVMERNAALLLTREPSNIPSNTIVSMEHIKSAAKKMSEVSTKMDVGGFESSRTLGIASTIIGAMLISVADNFQKLNPKSVFEVLSAISWSLVETLALGAIGFSLHDLHKTKNIERVRIASELKTAAVSVFVDPDHVLEKDINSRISIYNQKLR